jgi:tRNA nucleotidyltransferase (CCA-adding enzyme)
MEIYPVGGAVRDKLLGIPVKDRDWVVVAGNPELLLQQGFTQVGKDFPVFLHPETKEEYALARTERKTAPGYSGFEFDTSQEVTLEQDLMRRDLTINAMAESESGEIVDPYNGREDIKKRMLRHVSPAFSEDPLRVLRVAKFAARFADLGFTVAEETTALMREIVQSGELEHLVKERVWQEFEEALGSENPRVFIEVLRSCGALQALLPEVEVLFGIPQPEKYHPEIDTGVHTLMCLDQAASLSNDAVVRYATLIHDVGKGVTDSSKWPAHLGHEMLGLKPQKEIAARLHVPKEFAQLAAIVCEHHTKLHRVEELRPVTLLRLLEQLDVFRRPERLEKFLTVCEADAKGRLGLEDQPYAQRQYLMSLVSSISALDIPALLKESNSKDPKETIANKRLELISDEVERLRGETERGICKI